MKKVSILIPHFKTWRWTAICIWHFKQFGIPVDSEIILVNNSPNHPSIKAITETELGKGVTVIEGRRDFSSHGMGYDIAAKAATGDYLFTSETDSFPTRHGYFDDYIKAVGEGYDLIGPEIPQNAGRYIHPAGALYRSAIMDSAHIWRVKHEDWVFCPGAGLRFGFDRPYHVVCHKSLERQACNNSECRNQINLWRSVGSFQEMRSFDNDDWGTYPQRSEIKNFEPLKSLVYQKIGYEAGQWLAYFAEKFGFKVMRVPVDIRWMEGRDKQQAEASLIFGGGFTHIWCGTVSNVSGGNLFPDVLKTKIDQQNEWFSRLPKSLQGEINELERKTNVSSHQS